MFFPFLHICLFFLKLSRLLIFFCKNASKLWMLRRKKWDSFYTWIVQVYMWRNELDWNGIRYTNVYNCFGMIFTVFIKKWSKCYETDEPRCPQMGQLQRDRLLAMISISLPIIIFPEAHVQLTQHCGKTWLWKIFSRAADLLSQAWSFWADVVVFTPLYIQLVVCWQRFRNAGTPREQMKKPDEINWIM